VEHRGALGPGCPPLEGWPQPNGVRIYPDVSTLPVAPAFAQSWIETDGYMIPTGTYTNVNVSNTTTSFIPLRGVFPVKKGQYIALQQAAVGAEGRLQLDVWPTDMGEQDIAMLAAYAINAGSSDTLVNIYEWLTNRIIGGVSIGTPDTINTQTITEAIWSANGSSIQATGFQIYTSGGSVGADAEFRIRWGGVTFYSGILGAGAPRGSLAGFEGGQHPSSNSGDITIECAALGAGVTSTMNYWFKVRA